MIKRVLKWLGAIVAVVLIAFAVFLVNLIWFRPWSLNLFYEKVFAEVVFDHRSCYQLSVWSSNLVSRITMGSSTMNRRRINSTSSTDGTAT